MTYEFRNEFEEYPVSSELLTWHCPEVSNINFEEEDFVALLHYGKIKMFFSRIDFFNDDRVKCNVYVRESLIAFSS